MRWDSPAQQWGSKKGLLSPSSILCSNWSLKKLGEAHLLWGGQCTLLNPLIQILIPSRKTLLDTPRNKIMFNLGTPRPVQLTHKINHHTSYTKYLTFQEWVDFPSMIISPFFFFFLHYISYCFSMSIGVKLSFCLYVYFHLWLWKTVFLCMQFREDIEFISVLWTYCITIFWL